MLLCNIASQCIQKLEEAYLKIIKSYMVSKKNPLFVCGLGRKIGSSGSMFVILSKPRDANQ